MLSRGFSDLGHVNPELAYNVILDILSGINESVEASIVLIVDLTHHLIFYLRNHSIRQHISTQRGLFPHRLIRRKTEMTSKGLVVVEQEEIPSEVDVLPPRASRSPPSSPPSSPVPPRRSPIAELLYMRWMEGLRLKWPSLS
jgi:serine/threonine-protein kinase 24/25/MST4